MAKREKKWKVELAIDAYMLAYTGATNRDIAKVFLIEEDTFTKWLVSYPVLRYAVDKARGKRNERPETFQEYVYGKLPPDLKALWDQIQFWSEHENSVVRIEELLQPHGDRVRQQLWLHAMICCNFNASEACAEVNISKRVIDRWLAEDNAFPELLQELEWHKKNYFEDAMVDLVGMRVFPAVIHANKTFNRDRGYGEKIEIDHKHTHTHKVHFVQMDKLQPYLDLETRVKIREAIRIVNANKDEDEVDSPLALEHRSRDE